MSSTFNVAPRFTPGSPGVVTHEIAVRVAEEEKRGHARALTGAMGDEDKKKAESQGLSLIVWQMKTTARGWHVKDLITDECSLWPYIASCPECEAKKVNCKRGWLEGHFWPRSSLLCTYRGYVGRPLTDQEKR